MDWNKATLAQLWKEHKWTISLTVLAFLFAVCVISYGFFKALFIFLCVGVGIFAGLQLDRKHQHKDKTEDFWENGR
ncbi:MAG: DUF2273 domain-containing protein [Firmicutes bacterium]|nr:DUF2273 domain-containing protein [Bacillota bacterium]